MTVNCPTPLFRLTSPDGKEVFKFSTRPGKYAHQTCFDVSTETVDQKDCERIRSMNINDIVGFLVDLLEKEGWKMEPIPEEELATLKAKRKELARMIMRANGKMLKH